MLTSAASSQPIPVHGPILEEMGIRITYSCSCTAVGEEKIGLDREVKRELKELKELNVAGREEGR